jgi:purine-binding chemotaxis protein CheW
MNASVAPASLPADSDTDRADQRMLLFGIGSETLAIPAIKVREILEVPPVTRVPGAPALVDGLVNVRGAVVPLADLRVAFAMPAGTSGEDARLIVVEETFDTEREVIGIMADRVRDVCELDPDSFDPPPEFGMRWRADYVEAIGRRAGAFVIIPKLAEILRECAG